MMNLNGVDILVLLHLFPRYWTQDRRRYNVVSIQRNSKNLNFTAFIPSADLLTLFVFDSPTPRLCEKGYIVSHCVYLVKSSSFRTTSSDGLLPDAGCSATLQPGTTVAIHCCHHLSNSSFSLTLSIDFHRLSSFRSCGQHSKFAYSSQSRQLCVVLAGHSYLGRSSLHG